jgi:hypothetical protein
MTAVVVDFYPAAKRILAAKSGRYAQRKRIEAAAAFAELERARDEKIRALELTVNKPPNAASPRVIKPFTKTT